MEHLCHGKNHAEQVTKHSKQARLGVDSHAPIDHDHAPGQARCDHAHHVRFQKVHVHFGFWLRFQYRQIRIIGT